MGHSGQLLIVFLVSLAAGIASLAGGVIAILARPTSLLLSCSVGFAGGVLLGTFAFEMMPKALERSSLAAVIAGFVLGFALVYALDLFVNRGRMAGRQADENIRVRAFHIRHRPRGTQVTVLAGATSAEELIEGLTIGVGAAIDPSVAIIVGLAIVIDNVSESLSIGELARSEARSGFKGRIVKWTGLIGLSVFVSAMAGWFLLRGLPQGFLGFLLAVGAGAMFYLTVSDLIPEAQERQYEQSSAIALAAGFLIIFVLSELV